MEMTEENKALLLKDLSARLPYGVKCRFETTIDTYETIEFSREGTNGLLVEFDEIYCYWLNEGFIFPYLRPMSSMTEEEFNDLKSYSGLIYDQLELQEFFNNSKCLEFYLSEIPSYVVILVFDWLNAHHFDYRGLIPMGLALESPEGMYK